jgi:hypothetical protein
VITYPGRLRRLAHLRRLDPGHDYWQIYRTMVREEFRHEARLGLLAAFWREFAVPEIAGLLDATGKTVTRPGKRADDTGILMYEVIDHGFEHPRGRAAVRRLNEIHRSFGSAISNDTNRYVLATLVFVPARWIDRYGWRPLCCHERTATYHFYRELGRRLGIRDIPDSWTAYEHWFDEYERRHVARTDAAVRLMTASRSILARFPRPVRLAGRSFVDTVILDGPIRDAVGAARPGPVARLAWPLVLRLRARVQRLTPPRPAYHRDGDLPTASYPDGYDIAAVGSTLPAAYDRPAAG